MKLKPIKKKRCKYCKKTFKKHVDLGYKAWEKRMFCSVSCLHSYIKEFGAFNIGTTLGRPANSGSFKKGEHRNPSTEFDGSYSGSKHWNWKGGITKEHDAIRTSAEIKKWKKNVFERDNYTCVWCGSRNGRGKKVVLNADHIKPFAKYPDLRFDLDNGRTLCIDCHKKTDTYAGRSFRYA